MNIEDLQHIFKDQIDSMQGLDKPIPLYFMLVDGDSKLMQRRSHEDLESLLPMLDSFQYAGSDNEIPRFVKG